MAYWNFTIIPPGLTEVPPPTSTMGPPESDSQESGMGEIIGILSLVITIGLILALAIFYGFGR